jgi:TatD DNase family protein
VLTAVGVIDSHCHLQSLVAAELEAILSRARDRGVRGFLVPAVHLDEADRLLEIAAGHSDIWLALGVHPHEAKRWGRGSQERLGDLLKEPQVVAVGECGLDFHYDLSPRDKQLSCVIEQWELAQALDLPVIVRVMR